MLLFNNRMWFSKKRKMLGSFEFKIWCNGNWLYGVCSIGKYTYRIGIRIGRRNK